MLLSAFRTTPGVRHLVPRLLKRRPVPVRSTKAMFTLHQYGLASLAVLLTGSPSSDVIDRTVGYVLTVPAGWEQVPDDVLKAYCDAFGLGAADTPQFLAAFEPAEHDTYFQYPYALLQVHPHDRGTRLATVSRQQLESMVVTLTGMPVELPNGLSDDVASLFRGASVDSAKVTIVPPGFVMGVRTNLDGIGAIRGSSMAVFGKTNSVYLHFYALESDWSKYEGVLAQFASGFRRTQAQEILIGNSATLRSGIDWDRIGAQGIVAAIVGAVAGVLAHFKARAARKKSRSTVQSGDSGGR